MFRRTYSLDDVLMVPRYSEVDSRANVSLKVDLGKGVVLGNPVISANMKTVTGAKMAAAIANLGGLGLHHRFYGNSTQYLDAVKLSQKWSNSSNIGVSVGIKDHDKELVDMFANEGVSIVCVDVAHGDSLGCIKMVEWISKKYPGMLLIAGNVATGSGARNLYKSGADVVKCNVGSGSICSTRLETGNGIPTLTAIMDVAEVADLHHFKFIADGGLKKVGDICKAVAFADAVMLGRMLAGTDETPGGIVNVDDEMYKEYAGSSTHKTNRVEGVVGLVPYNGPVKNVMQKICEGLQSCCSYQGVFNLDELKLRAEFVEITNSGQIESGNHSLSRIVR